MFDLVWEYPATPLNRPDYHADSDRVEERMSGVIWKLERAQYVSEQGDEAWDAFVDGDWPLVMAIYESERDAIRKAVEEEAKQGVEFRRLRIVELPPSSYIRWELPSLRISAECGRLIRVLDARRIADLERKYPLPEMLVCGDHALYHVQYDEQKVPIGARKIDDRQIVGSAAASVAALYAQAEPLTDFVEREITPLGPPKYAE